MTIFSPRARLCAAIILATAPLPAARAQSLSAADLADGRCMAALTMMGEKPGPAGKAALDPKTMYYFMGKIAGRSGKAAVGPAIGAGSATVTEANLASTAEACIAEIKGAIKLM